MSEMLANPPISRYTDVFCYFPSYIYVYSYTIIGKLKVSKIHLRIRSENGQTIFNHRRHKSQNKYTTPIYMYTTPILRYLHRFHMMTYRFSFNVPNTRWFSVDASIYTL